MRRPDSKQKYPISRAFDGWYWLEPVTPSLSSPQDATPTFAPARASRCLCRSFRASQHRVFARVCDLWRLLVLAPVSTGRRWCGLLRTSEQLVLREAPRPGGATALPTRPAPGTCPPLSDRDPRSAEGAAHTGHRTGSRAHTLSTSLPLMPRRSHTRSHALVRPRLNESARVATSWPVPRSHRRASSHLRSDHWRHRRLSRPDGRGRWFSR
jgi:hypothetical protein